eukprot:TRINITY_DN2801_c0_g1_i1.p1 TRINITY_DN2801_c0_g1~~TRINITY_DN2801_c0_g1_i1.p1  ORF type:complete len:197 (+),score=19.11 TRINITY_DN2801_c0_g1_i1:59-592(+)
MKVFGLAALFMLINGCVGASTQGSATTADCGHTMDCSAFPDGYYPDMYNCRKYFHCYSGQMEHVTCENGEYYNADLIQCDWPDRVDCGGRPVCDECDHDCFTQTAPPSTTARQGCAHHICTEDGLFAEQCCDNTYCQCFGGVGYLMHCEEQLVFNGELHNCDWPYNLECCSKNNPFL